MWWPRILLWEPENSNEALQTEVKRLNAEVAELRGRVEALRQAINQVAKRQYDRAVNPSASLFDDLFGKH